MTPVERVEYWILERENIRNQRRLKMPPPWTTDPILSQYRFCNVVRIDDKVSQWLLKNWYIPYRDHPNMLAAVALARFFNLPLSLEAITDRVFREGRPDWAGIRSRLQRLKKLGTVFNAAYMVRGNDGVDKVESVVTYNVMPLFRRKGVLAPRSMEETWRNVSAVHGYGSFMAGQIVADLRWAVSGAWSDRREWAPMGPGSRRGMNRVLERPVNSPMTQEEFLSHLTDLRYKIGPRLPEGINERMEAIDWQNVMCEHDKYERTRLGEGRPKQRYRPC